MKQKRCTGSWGGDTMRKAILIAALTIGLLTVPFLVHAEVYKWIDGKGTIHFTDDYSNIPSSYRKQLKVEIRRDIQGQEPPPLEPQKIIPRSKEEAKTASVQETQEEKRDARGMSEDYWRDRVRPWKKQLEETTEGYEYINRKIDGALEAMRGRFLSKTQYNFGRIEVENLMKERGTYEAKKKEANEMLAKIAKEAEEAKADPAWLR